MAAPKLRFKEFDGDWSAQKYKDALTIKYGKDHKLLEDGEIPVYGTGGVMRYVNQYLYDGESILIGRKGTIDQPKYVNEKFWTVDTLFYSEIKQNIYPLFIYQHALQVNWLGLNEATGVPSLNTTSINNVDIYLPSKEEQTKIASFLSAVDEKISQLTQKHELLSQYKQGMMQKLFSQQLRFKADDGSEFGEWEKTKFLDLMVDLWDYRGKTPKKLGMDWGNGEIQSLSALNIKKGFIDFDADCHLGSEKLYKTWMNKGDLEKGDIIFTMEAPLGNVALIPDDRKYILSQRVVCFKTNKKMVDNKFIYQLILSDQFQSRIEELATGTTAKGINQKSMQKIEVTLPPKDEQTKIANFLSAIDQKNEVVAQQIEQAKTWKKGLLQQMFV